MNDLACTELVKRLKGPKATNQRPKEKIPLISEDTDTTKVYLFFSNPIPKSTPTYTHPTYTNNATTP